MGEGGLPPKTHSDQTMKVRSDSVLAQLDQSQLADLYDWILSANCYADAQARAAKPADEGGLGLALHITTLRRFYGSYTNWLRAKEIVEGERASSANPDDLHTSAATELAHSIHDLAHGPLNASDLKLVAKYLQQQRDHALKLEYLKIAERHAALATEKQNLAREMFEEQKRLLALPTSGQGSKAGANSQSSHRAPDPISSIEERAKIWKAREICFGPDPNHPTPESLYPLPTDPMPIPESSALSPEKEGRAPSLRARRLADPVSGAQTHAVPEKSTQIHAVPENTLSAQSSVLTPEVSTHCDTLFHAPTENLPQTESARRQTDAVPDTQIHAPQENPVTPVQSLERSEIPIHRDDTLKHTTPEPAALTNPEPRPQSTVLSAGVVRTTSPKPPAAWLAAARRPSDLRRHFWLQYCSSSPDLLDAFLASPEPLALPHSILASFGELP